MNLNGERKVKVGFLDTLALRINSLRPPKRTWKVDLRDIVALRGLVREEIETRRRDGSGPITPNAALAEMIGVHKTMIRTYLSVLQPEDRRYREKALKSDAAYRALATIAETSSHEKRSNASKKSGETRARRQRGLPPDQVAARRASKSRAFVETIRAQKGFLITDRVFPHYLRGASNTEISQIEGLDFKKVSNARGMLNRKVKEGNLQLPSPKIEAKRSNPKNVTDPRVACLLRELNEAGLIPNDTRVWRRMNDYDSKYKLGLPQSYAERLKLEVLLRVLGQRSRGDNSDWERYLEIGRRNNKVWFEFDLDLGKLAISRIGEVVNGSKS